MQTELFEAAKLQEYNRLVAERKMSEGGEELEGAKEGDGKGILPFVVKPEPDGQDVTGRAGLPLVVEAFRGHSGDKLVEQHLKLKLRKRGYSEVEFVEAFLLLQAAGGDHLDDFEVLREDGGLCRLLDRQLPSPDAGRGFLLRFHDEKLIKAAEQRAQQVGELSFVPEESKALAGLGQVHAGFMRSVADPTFGTVATLDHDATIIDSYKQEAKWHYKGGKGYQPVAVYWAEQGLVVADEFRDGNVPAGKNNLRLIQRAFLSLPEWVTELGFRADSACYEERVLQWLANPERKGGPKGKIGFTISADMSVELKAACERVLEPDALGEEDEPRWEMLDDTRANETVEWAEIEFTPGNWPKDAKPLRYLVLRFKRRQGELFPSGERVKNLAVVTNRRGPGDEIIRWHWKKAGTIEHVHDETKNGLGAGVLPCAEFGANAAWYRLTMLTFNVLVSIKRLTLPPEQQQVRAKRLRFLVFDLAAKITRHARYLFSHIKDTALSRIKMLAARTWYRLHRRGVIPVPSG